MFRVPGMYDRSSHSKQIVTNNLEFLKNNLKLYSIEAQTMVLEDEHKEKLLRYLTCRQIACMFNISRCILKKMLELLFTNYTILLKVIRNWRINL